MKNNLTTLIMEVRKKHKVWDMNYYPIWSEVVDRCTSSVCRSSNHLVGV